MRFFITFTSLALGGLGALLANILIGFLGSRRKIGFSWAFCLSALLSPLMGLIITLLTDKLPDGKRKFGWFGILLGTLIFIFYILVLLLLMMGL